MKNEEMLKSMDLIDEKYIEEAAPQKAKKVPLKAWVKLALIAASVCIMLTVINLVLFLPFQVKIPDIGKYSSSPYYAIIEKLNLLNIEKPKYKNNFEKWFSASSPSGGNAMSGNADLDLPNSSPDLNDDLASSPSEDKYHEITDNQVAGVTEGDIIKRSDKYIFYYSSSAHEIRVYSIENENSARICTYNLYEAFPSFTDEGIYFNEKNNTEEAVFHSIKEMYLTKDCQSLITVSNRLDNNWRWHTLIVSHDVSNPREGIKQKSFIELEGEFKSSRAVDGKLLVFTRYGLKNIDFSNPETFIPSVNVKDNDENSFVDCEKIVCPDMIGVKQYTVAYMINESTFEYVDTCAFLSYSEDIYVSKENIYSYREKSIKNGNESIRATEISAFAYNENGFTKKGSVTVNGYLKDRYSLDEFNGILRVVSTTQATVDRVVSYPGNLSYVFSDVVNRNASLYCIDLNTFEVVSSVENFAPPGETVRSVRFDGDYLYVCTAIQLSDPVFYFDLSDIYNITYKETGTISGFSTSLIQLGNGYLLGVGVADNSSTVKVEVYKEAENQIVSVCSFCIQNATYSTDYKSYFINRDAKMFGFGATVHYPTRETVYFLLQFDGNQLVTLASSALNGEAYSARGVLIDDYFYLFGSNDFQVIKTK